MIPSISIPLQYYMYAGSPAWTAKKRIDQSLSFSGSLFFILFFFRLAFFLDFMKKCINAISIID
ncbi:Uncharacterised protein [Mycobacteroides abscessus subsp. abscessus]|nr:Uncharacterised protein [Mycobacteroides abscessus subsp. abscessus]